MAAILNSMCAQYIKMLFRFFQTAKILRKNIPHAIILHFQNMAAILDSRRPPEAIWNTKMHFYHLYSLNWIKITWNDRSHAMVSSIMKKYLGGFVRIPYFGRHLGKWRIWPGPNVHPAWGRPQNVRVGS